MLATGRFKNYNIMDKFKNLDVISNRLEKPIKNLYNNLLEGHTGSSVMLITEIEQEMRRLKEEIERLKMIESKPCC